MAVSKQDVLSYIAEHITSDRTKVPAKDIIAHLGSEAKAVIEQLKKDGTLKGNRGRSGGLTVIGEVKESEVVADSDSSDETDVASQFAALMNKMQADVEAESDSAVAVG